MAASEAGVRRAGGWEYHQLSLPAGTSRAEARTLLGVAAELGDWELAHHRVWPDGRRRILLRRRPARPAA